MSSPVFLVDGVQQWRTPPDPLTSHRREAWRVELLNLKDTSLRRLDGIDGGSFSFNVNAVIRGGGSMQYAGPELDWSQYRVQPWYSVTAASGVIEWPLGVFIPASPTTQYGATGRTGSIELYDKTHLLDRDRVDTTFVANTGAVVTSLIRSIIIGAGGVKVALTDSPAVLRKAMAWEVGTSKLQIVNDLLESINYFSVWVDGYGTFRADPYTDPAARLSQYSFFDDAKGIYLPDFSRDFDTFNVPNKVICIAQGDGETTALKSVATDTDPNSRFSYGRLGNSWITRFEESVEASDQATLDALCKRYLREGQQVGSTYEIEHAPLDLKPNDAVLFRRDSEGIDIKATVESIEYGMGSLCRTTLREVRP